MKHIVTATEFKAKCLDLLDQISHGEIDELEVTKRGHVVARVVPPHRAPTSLEAWHDMMRDTVHVPPGFDLTAPVHDEPWDAELGILHR